MTTFEMLLAFGLAISGLTHLLTYFMLKTFDNDVGALVEFIGEDMGELDVRLRVVERSLPLSINTTEFLRPELGCILDALDEDDIVLFESDEENT